MSVERYWGLWSHVWNSPRFESFFKNYTSESQVNLGEISRVEVMIIQFLLQFLLILKEDHS